MSSDSDVPPPSNLRPVMLIASDLNTSASDTAAPAGGDPTPSSPDSDDDKPFVTRFDAKPFSEALEPDPLAVEPEDRSAGRRAPLPLQRVKEVLQLVSAKPIGSGVAASAAASVQEFLTDLIRSSVALASQREVETSVNVGYHHLLELCSTEERFCFLSAALLDDSSDGRHLQSTRRRHKRGIT